MIERLKVDGMSAVFAIANGIFITISLIYLIYAALQFAAIIPFFQSIFNIDVQELMGLMEISDPFERQRVATELFAGIAQNFDSSMIIWIVLFAISALIFGSWFYNACFVAAEQYVLRERVSLGDVLKGSINKNIFTLLFATLLLTLIYILISMSFFVLMDLLSGGFVGGLIGLVLILLIGIILMRFVLVYPAIVHGNHGAFSALRFSWSSVSFGKAAKYFLIAIVVGIIFVIVAVIIGLFQALLLSIPYAGMVLYLLVSAILSGYLSAWVTAALSGLYYRRVPASDQGEVDISDHLVG